LTVEVLPFEQRPDVIYARRWYDARPYEAPASCPATPLTGPESRGESFFAHCWLLARCRRAQRRSLRLAHRESRAAAGHLWRGRRHLTQGGRQAARRRERRAVRSANGGLRR